MLNTEEYVATIGNFAHSADSLSIFFWSGRSAA